MFKRHRGQEEWRAFIEAHPTRPTFVLRMPTGTGKTEAILDGYTVLRDAGRCDRLLIVVPTGTQEDQYADELNDRAAFMGLELRKVVSATGEARTLRYHQRNIAEVFVTTIQRLDAAYAGRALGGCNWILELLKTGRWCGAADEYHHYADENIWGQQLEKLRARIPQWMAVSATPDRLWGRPLFGDPDITVTYDQALNEGIVKAVSIKVREYGVDIQPEDGPVERLTTTELRNAADGTTIDAYEARRQLRYLTRYCSPILYHAVGELLAKQASEPPLLPQMLVYAFSCAHAQAVAEILRSIPGELNVDWIGTGYNGRSDDENRTILGRFKDRIDRAGVVVERHTLDILVQVNKAAEGFNAKPVSVIVDLSLTGMGPQKLQQYGRGTRLYGGHSLVIYIPADSSVVREVARLVSEGKEHRMHELFDAAIEGTEIPDPCTCCRACPACEHHPERPPPPLPTMQVIDAELIQCMDYDPSPAEVYFVAHDTGLPGAGMDRAPDGGPWAPESNPAHFKTIHEALQRFHRKNADDQSEKTQLKYWQNQVTRALRAVVADAMRILGRNRTIEVGQDGVLMKRLHTQWKRQHGDGHEGMTTADFRAKYQWLERVQATMREDNRLPTWLQ